MAEIQLKGVTKRYPDGTEAVKAMDLDIGDGEFMILVGPSGCGKSTALRMIAGLEDISAGELVIGGETVNDLAPKDRDPGLVVGGRHIDYEPSGEAPNQALVQRLDFGRRPVAGQHDLAIRRLKRIGESKKLGLHFSTVGEKLHVVHKKKIHIVEAPAVGVALPRRDGSMEGLDELVQREVLD